MRSSACGLGAARSVGRDVARSGTGGPPSCHIGRSRRQRDIRAAWPCERANRGTERHAGACVMRAVRAPVRRPCPMTDAPMTATPPASRSATGCASRARRPIRRSRAGDAPDVDVAIIGGGFTGLWTAIALTDTDPSLRVVVLEAETVAFGASGRNGGFCEASLTHGLANGIRHFPDELERLEREGVDNLAGARSPSPATHGIDCDLEETGMLALADQAVPGRGVPGVGRRGGRVRRAPRVPGPRRRPGRGPLPALARRALPAARARRPGRPGQARAAGSPGSRASAGVRDPRAHAGHGARAASPAASSSRTAGGRRRSGPATSSSRRRPTRAGSGGCRRCSCRSTTTSSCRSR